MIDREIRLTIAGHPKPKGSLKCIGARGRRGHVLIEDNKGTKPWRTEITRLARQATQSADVRQPIGVEMTATLARPKSHYGTGRNATTLKDNAPEHPVGHNTGDTDKLVRLFLDALQDAKVLPDDCIVVELTARKAYAGTAVPMALEYPGIRARIYPLAPPAYDATLPIEATP